MQASPQRETDGPIAYRRKTPSPLFEILTFARPLRSLRSSRLKLEREKCFPKNPAKNVEKFRQTFPTTQPKRSGQHLARPCQKVARGCQDLARSCQKLATACQHLP